MNISAIICSAICGVIVYGFIGYLIFIYASMKAFIIYICVFAGMIFLMICGFLFSCICKNSPSSHSSYPSENTKLYVQKEIISCFKCNLTGVYYETVEEVCDQCHGRAFYISHIVSYCNKCHGYGRIKVKKEHKCFHYGYNAYGKV